MANLYFQLNEGCTYLGKPIKYAALSFEIKKDEVLLGLPHVHLDMTRVATKVWIEENGNVIYLKNRFGSTGEPIDTKEFMWVKLRAEWIKY